MWERAVRITRVVLLAFCLILFFQPTITAVEVTGYFFEPITEDSVRWTPIYMNQRVGPDHLYGNFSMGLTFDEPPEYVLFYIWQTRVVGDSEYSVMYWLENATSAPYECNFSTLDWSVGEHDVGYMKSDSHGSGLDGGGRTYFFEHQDKSGEQILYASASLTVITASLISLFGVGFACYRLAKWHYSKPGKRTTSRFER